MRVFQTKYFAKWARKKKISLEVLQKVIKEMEEHLIDAKLGHNIYKKRISLNGWGKRGGARSIIVYKMSEKAFFIYGYAKNTKEDLNIYSRKLGFPGIRHRDFCSFKRLKERKRASIKLENLIFWSINEEKSLRLLAEELLSYLNEQLKHLINVGELTEIQYT